MSADWRVNLSLGTEGDDDFRHATLAFFYEDGRGGFVYLKTTRDVDRLVDALGRAKAWIEEEAA